MKKTVSAILVIALLSALLFSFSLPVFSEGEQTKSYNIDIFKKELWVPGGDVSDISEKHAADGTLLVVNAVKESRSVSIRSEFEAVDLSEYTEAALRLAIRGEGEKYDVEVILYSGDIAVSVPFSVTNDEAVLYIPIPKEIAPAFDGIYISAKCADKPLNYMNLISFTADNTYTYSYEKLFGCSDVYSENEYERTAESFTVTADNGEARVSFDFSEKLTENDNILVWVALSTAASGSISAETVDAEGTAFASPQQTVSYNGTYSFLLKGGFEDFSLRLFGLSDKSAKITLTGAGIYSVGEAQKSYGSISSCRYDGKKISVSGALSKEATAEYNGSRILLYAIPATDVGSFEIMDYKPVASSGFSTKFRINCELDKTYAEYFYKVVLDTKDGLLPVGNICAPAGGATTQSTIATHTVMYGADAADAFETNISAVIVDIFAGKLLENEDIYSAQIYNYKKRYYFNKEYLKELDDRMQFYASAGVDVYFRFYSDNEGYTFDYSADSPESISLMCAVSGFISERYPKVKGYIMGVAANEHITNLTAEYAESKARLLAVFCESVRAKNPTTQVIVPYSANTGADPYLTCALLSHYLSKYKSGALAYMYETTKDISASYSAAAHLSSIAAQFAAPSNGAAVLWNAPSTSNIEEITKGYRELCDHAQLLGLRFAALSVARAEKSPALYDSLKTMLDMENLIDTQISRFEPVKNPSDFLGSYALWDFTSSYDTAGWVSGGSFSRPVTAKGEKGQRVMMVEGSGLSEGAGILIGKTDTSLDLSDVCARVSFSVVSAEAKTADVTVIFGSGETRAEFIATVECNKATSLVCDMKDFAGSESVDYAALIVRSQQNAGANVSKIELCSSSESSEALEAKFRPPMADEHDPLLYIIIIFVMAGTVTVFSVLLKKQISRKKK